MEAVIYIALALIGAAMGSFAGATVWRLRARQLDSDKKHKQRVDEKEYKALHKLGQTKLTKDRSRCLHCGHVLRWYDLIPIVSWLSLKGRCRYCHKPIGAFELLIELGVAAFFVLSYLAWPLGLEAPLEIARFVIWLAAGVVMAMLLAYDLKWMLLPDALNAVLAALGVATVMILAVESPDPLSTVLTAAGALGILSGLYLFLHLVSRGRWVGFGDVKLGVGLALLLADWQLALVALFLANFIGCLIVIPLLAAKKLTRSSRIPFGPLLILGTILTHFIGPALIGMYVASFL